jgi:8-oxo-dGTP pyrophosphatase MutT (NUDIX family)
LIAINEYKYAIDQTIINLPSGTMETGVDIIEMAKRELLEETGYSSDRMEIIKKIYEYPSKLTHCLYIVRAKDCKKISEVKHDFSEQIGEVVLLDPESDKCNKFNTSYNIAALAITVPEFIR